MPLAVLSTAKIIIGLWSDHNNIGWQGSSKEEKERTGEPVSMATEGDTETANC